MKKTFKVKNILKNKNKYNFKTELLLSALSLLVAFGTVSCKKDPVKPKENNTETPVVPPKDTVDTKTPEERLLNLEKQFTLEVDGLKSVGLYERFKNYIHLQSPNISFKTFYDSVVGNPFFVDPKEAAKSGFSSINDLDSTGYKYLSNRWLNDLKEINDTTKRIKILQRIVDACNLYLKEYEMQNKTASNSR